MRVRDEVGLFQAERALLARRYSTRLGPGCRRRSVSVVSMHQSLARSRTPKQASDQNDVCVQVSEIQDQENALGTN